MSLNIQQVAIPGSNYQNGRSLPIDQITFHHIVGDAPAALARFKTPGVQVSATYVISSTGEIFQCVDEDDTPYTDANFNSNSRAITIEHAGGGGGVAYTDAMYAASAELVADIRSRYDITRFMRHRDVSKTPTACPGTLDVERIIKASEEDVADKIDQTLSRIIRYHVLGRNGLAGRPYALNGSDQEGDPWIGMDLTAEFLIEQYDSQEARDFRGDTNHADSIVGVNAQLASIPALNQQIKDLQKALGQVATGSGYSEADRAKDAETNSIVKQIWGKISSIFK